MGPIYLNGKIKFSQVYLFIFLILGMYLWGAIENYIQNEYLQELIRSSYILLGSVLISRSTFPWAGLIFKEKKLFIKGSILPSAQFYGKSATSAGRVIVATNLFLLIGSSLMILLNIIRLLG